MEILFFKQKTAYEMRISDWSSDVCSSDLLAGGGQRQDDRYRPFVGDQVERAADHAGTNPPAIGRQVVAEINRDRKSVVEGTSVSVRVDLGGRRIIKKKKTKKSP